MRADEAIRQLMNGVTFEEPKPSPCPRCDGSGVLKSWKDGKSHIEPCPICAAKEAHEARLKLSGISKEDYEKYTLDTFKADTEEARRMKAAAEYYLANAKKEQSIGYFGKPGTGKTHICIALCQASNRPHYYWQYRAEIQRIKNAAYRLPKEYDELIKKAGTASFLYIDDLFKGAVINGGLSKQDEQIMFDIINRRYMNHLPTIFSSELPLKRIMALDEGIGSRIGEMVGMYAITCTGVNRRVVKL